MKAAETKAKQEAEEAKLRKEEEERKIAEEEEQAYNEIESDHHGRIFIDYRQPKPSVFPVSNCQIRASPNLTHLSLICSNNTSSPKRLSAVKVHLLKCS